MKIKEYIDEIVKHGNKDDMNCLGDMLTKLICDTKETDPEKYDKYKMKLYVMAYGKVLTREMAEEIVENMSPYGENWSYETTTQVKSSHMIRDISDIDFYVVMNMMYNDYYNTINKYISEEKQVEFYIDLTRNFIFDEDAKEGKVFNYFMTIPE